MTPDPAVMADPARRRLRVQLLKDLVSNGLYRVDTGALAEKLMSVLKLGRRQR